MAVVVVVLALVVSSGLIAAVSGAAARQADENQSEWESMASAPPTVDPAPVYYISDRPGWDAMVEYIDGTYERWQTAFEDDTIYNYVPSNRPGYEYAYAFVVWLRDYRLAYDYGAQSTNPAELDAKIQSYVDAVAELEAKFLAGEDLNITVLVTNADGTTSEWTGAAPPTAPQDPDDYAGPVDFAYNYEPIADPDGRYISAAALLASAFGMHITYDYDPIAAGCSVDPDDDPSTTIAFFCTASPQLIWVNPGFWGYPDNLSTLDFIDTLRHEISHRLIFDHCGTSRPPIAGDRAEGVTNSFAIRYLGADPANMSTHDEYYFDSTTDAIAQQIASGRCS